MKTTLCPEPTSRAVPGVFFQFKRLPRCFRFTLVTVMLLGIMALVSRLALHLVPLPPALFTSPVSELELLDRNGEALRVVRPGNSPFVHWVTYSEVPQTLLEATLAAEDRLFWKHSGIEWRGTMRAAWQLVHQRRIVSGGSSISQQLIKLAQPRPRTFATKVIEALQALRLEQKWGKQRILEQYLNRLDYGNFNRGCAAAAQFYFAKPLLDLSPAECALLAGLPQAPSRLNPHLYLERAIKRQRWILGQMRRSGWLKQDQYERALKQPLHLSAPDRHFEAPHFVDLVLSRGAGDQRSGVSSIAGGATLPKPGIRTTLDLGLNRFAETILRRRLSGLEAHHVRNGAIVVIDNRTRELLALVGSEDYFGPTAGQVNGACAKRSAGSTLKPFTYLLALQRGATPATIIADVPTEFPTALGLFAPANYDQHCYGPMRYRLALANSLNISAVKVLASIGGPAPLQQFLQDCGLTTLTHPAQYYGLGLTIGNAETRLLELANAYACLATLGQYAPIRWWLQAPSPRRPGSRRVADASAAYLIADILSDNAARTLAFGPRSALHFDFPVACKTGTSSDFRDNWALGYTPEFTVGVWVGNFDGSPMQQISGVSGAAPILHDLFVHLRASYGTTWYAPPDNVVYCSVHPLTGKRVNPAERSDAIEEKFIESNLPAWENETDYDRSGKAVLLDHEYREWFAGPDNRLQGKAVLGPAPDAPRIDFPPPGTTFLLDPDLPDQGRRLQLSVQGLVECGSDSLMITAHSGGWTARLEKGRHEIWARTPGRAVEARTWINVVAP